MEENVRIRWKRNSKYYCENLIKIVLIKTFEDLLEKYPQNNSNSKELKRIIRISEDIFINWDETKATEDLKLYFWIADGSRGKLLIGPEHKIVRMLLNGYCFAGEEIPNEFKMRWNIQGAEHVKILDRYQVQKEFEIILERNPENNEISKRIVHIMPVIKEAYVNWDNTANDNYLYYQLLEEDKCEGIRIGCHHKKVWNKLKQICDML